MISEMFEDWNCDQKLDLVNKCSDCTWAKCFAIYSLSVTLATDVEYNRTLNNLNKELTFYTKPY